MKTRPGYISIIAIIILCVTTIMIFEIITIVERETTMLNKRVDKVQSYYCSEGKVLLAIYDDKYYLQQSYPILLEVFRNNNFATSSKEIVIDDLDLEDGDTYNKVRISFQDRKNRKEMVLKTKSNYRNIQTNVKAYVNLVNVLFETENPILAPNTVPEEHRLELVKFLINMEENITSIDIVKPEALHTSEFCDFTSVKLKKPGNNLHKLIATRENMEYPYSKNFDEREVFIVIKEYNGEKTSFYVHGDENLIELSGIIYVEGDMVISSEFVFNGIIVVKNGKIIVESEVNPIINGMIIFSDTNAVEEIESMVDLSYNKFLVYRYGTFLPGFLDLNINLIKNGN